MSVLHITKDNFEAEVMGSEKPVLIDFWATWCGPCRMIAPVIEEIADETTGVVIAKVNVDEEPEIAGSFGVMSIPTIVVIKGGKVVDHAVGARPKAAILKMLEGSKA